jgi:hypothetical protein
MLQQPLELPQKPAKPDPFADAPGVPSDGRVRRGLLGLALVAIGLTTLVGCLGLARLVLGPPWKEDRPSGSLVVTIPDQRLIAMLRLEKVDRGYNSRDALQTANGELEVAPGTPYQLAPGNYRLRVKSDDVVVGSKLIRIVSGTNSTYEVAPGGILHIHADPQAQFITVTVNGERCIDNAMQPSRRMLVVPEGTVRVKASWGNHQIYGERLVDVKAGKELFLKASLAGVEELPAQDGGQR